MSQLKRWRTTVAASVPALMAVALLSGTLAATAQGAATPSRGGVPVPTLIGPVPETASSYPFGRPNLNLAAYGYEEQEFFVKGTANVYSYDSSGNVVTNFRDAPYETRIVVYRPIDPRRFSGTVLTDIMNMTNGYDFPILWAYTHDELMADGDVFVGVTSSPNAIAALQKFNPVRYADLSMAAPAGDTCSGRQGINSTATTEGGLVWDMLSQVGAALKSHGRSNPLGNLITRGPVRVYLSGYSQSGGYLLRYINAINASAKVYDGFLIGSGVDAPTLSKCEAAIPGDSNLNVVQPTAQPVIAVNTQTDFQGLGGDSVVARADSDTATDKYRLWQVAGASHNSDYLNWFHPSASDLAKVGGSVPAYDCDTTPGLSGNFPQEYLLDSAFADLDAWARRGIAPPSASRIEVDAEGNTVLDAYGNAIGGVRTPYVDVPVATYYPTSTSNNPAESFTCALYGHVVPLPTGTINELYPNHVTYVSDVYKDVQKLVAERFLTPTDGLAIENAANLANIPN